MCLFEVNKDVLQHFPAAGHESRGCILLKKSVEMCRSVFECVVDGFKDER